MLTDRDASHALNDRCSAEPGPRRYRTPCCQWQAHGSCLLTTNIHLAGSHPHALGRVLRLAASHGRQIGGRRHR